MPQHRVSMRLAIFVIAGLSIALWCSMAVLAHWI
jgi:hypothetical protein